MFSETYSSSIGSLSTMLMPIPFTNTFSVMDTSSSAMSKLFHDVLIKQAIGHAIHMFVSLSASRLMGSTISAIFSSSFPFCSRYTTNVMVF